MTPPGDLSCQKFQPLMGEIGAAWRPRPVIFVMATPAATDGELKFSPPKEMLPSSFMVGVVQCIVRGARSLASLDPRVHQEGRHSARQIDGELRVSRSGADGPASLPVRVADLVAE